jgi:hypothetical protein
MIRLFSALRRLPGWVATESRWRELLGDELDRVRPLLLPRDEIAGTIRLDGLPARRVVSARTEDDVVAVCDETGSVTPLHRLSVRPVRTVRRATCSRGRAGSRDRAGHLPLSGCRFAWWLGQMSDPRGTSRRAVLVADAECAAGTRSLHAATASATAPLLIIPLTSQRRHTRVGLLLAANGALCLPRRERVARMGQPRAATHSRLALCRRPRRLLRQVNGCRRCWSGPPDR